MSKLQLRESASLDEFPHVSKTGSFAWGSRRNTTRVNTIMVNPKATSHWMCRKMDLIFFDGCVFSFGDSRSTASLAVGTGAYDEPCQNFFMIIVIEMTGIKTDEADGSF